MKKLNYVKFLLDLGMAVVFALLFNKMVLGITFHEVAGLAIGAVVLIHCGLNWKWIKGVTVKLFSRTLPMKTRIGYMLNILLLINMGIIIVSGIFISKTLFAGLGLGGAPIFKFLHISSSYIALALIGIHLGLHWSWVMSVFKKMFRIPDKRIFTYISRVLMLVVLAFGLYSANSVGYLSKISVSAAPKAENMQKGGDFRPERGEGVKPERGADFAKQGEGNMAGAPPMGKGGPGGNNNIIQVIATYLGITSVFTIAVYYLEKLLRIRRKRDLSPAVS